jgi:hypothetical protein
MRTEYRLQNFTENCHLGDVGLDYRVILKWCDEMRICDLDCSDLDCSDLDCNVQSRAFIIKLTKFLFGDSGFVRQVLTEDPVP